MFWGQFGRARYDRSGCSQQAALALVALLVFAYAVSSALDGKPGAAALFLGVGVLVVYGIRRLGS